MQRIAAFITPHGFGHTTRAIAVLESLQQRYPELVLQIFTTVPEYLFKQSLTNYRLHPVVTDVGLVQHDALHTDIPATLSALKRFCAFPPDQVNQLAKQVKNCNCILCDISPLGIIVARAAGVPSLLVENFTWDWIYQPHIAEHPEFSDYASRFADIYDQATLHIQAKPICNPKKTATWCSPVCRKQRSTRQKIRDDLKVGNRKLVLISLGGLGFTLPHWQQLSSFSDCLFIFAGQPERKTISDNCQTLTHDSEFYHPDLIGAADLVVFKSGYSTVAECYQAGTPTACITRPDFLESSILGDFVTTKLGGVTLDEQTFISGKWLNQLPELLTGPKSQLPRLAIKNGADQIADIVQHRFRNQL